MGSQPKQSITVQFGPFEFHGASGELRKHGLPIRLLGQPLQILCVLLERPGEVIGRDELQQQLWSGTTFVDFEHGLNAAVNKLRQALNDSADRPRYVETLPGRGYRFIGPVQRSPIRAVIEIAPHAPRGVPQPEHAGKTLSSNGEPALAESLTLPAPAPRAFRPARSSWRWKVAALACIVTIGAAYQFWNRRDRPLSRLVEFTVEPPAGFVLEPASTNQPFSLSPDGTRLVFSGMNASGSIRAWIREFAAFQPAEIPDSAGTHGSFWAPDSRSMFLAVRGKLRRYGVESKGFQELCDYRSILLGGTLLGPQQVLLSGRYSSVTVPASGGVPAPVSEYYQWPQILPDGQHILYVTFDRASGRYQARVAKWNEPASAQDLVQTDSLVMYAPSMVKRHGYLVYVRAGNLLVHPFDANSRRVLAEPVPIASHVTSFRPAGAANFSVSAGGVIAYQKHVSRTQLAWVDRQGRQIATLGPADSNVRYARLSPDGRKVVTSIYDSDRGEGDLWIYDLESGAGRKIAASAGNLDAPLWSPDSHSLVYHRSYGEPPKLWFRGIGENDKEERLPQSNFQVASDWFPDGRFVAFTNTGTAAGGAELQDDVWMIDMQLRKIVPLLNTPFDEANAVFSPSGKWLAFTSNESGRMQLYVQKFVGGETPHLEGERRLASSQGAIYAVWRRDGKELFYLGQDGTVYGVSVSSKMEFASPVPLFPISLDARAAFHSILAFDVSPDGRRFLVPVVTSTEKPVLVVVNNWESLLSRQQ